MKNFRETREFIRSIPDVRDQLMLRILYETGCNLSELVRLKAEDLRGNFLRLEARQPRISGKLAKDLRQYIKGNRVNGFIFATRQSSSISEKRVRQLIHMYSARFFGERMNPQNLRYMHIAHAYRKGVFIDDIAGQLGITASRVFDIIKSMDLKTKDRYNLFLKTI